MYNNIRSTARTSTLSVVFNIALKLFVNEICQKKKKKGIDALGWVEISKTISNYRGYESISGKLQKNNGKTNLNNKIMQ